LESKENEVERERHRLRPPSTLISIGIVDEKEVEEEGVGGTVGEINLEEEELKLVLGNELDDGMEAMEA